MNIQEAKDKVYIGKAGNKYLKGHSLVKSIAQADVFESETEPKQRLNQMKKDGIIEKDTKVKILSKRDENKKVTLNFFDNEEGEDFKKEMKARYNQVTSNKYQVKPGRGKTGKAVFVENEKLKESMKFVMERSTEPFKVREGSEYEVLYDESIDKYGLLVDGVLFCFLTADQAKTLSENIKNKEVFEKFFNSVGIGDKWLNLQPKAACDPNYMRPTGDIV